MSRDCEYEHAVISKVKQFLKLFDGIGLDSSDKKTLDEYSDGILRTVHLKYEGQEDDAYCFIIECVDKIKQVEPYVCSLNQCPSFFGFYPDAPLEAQLFRARIGDDFCTFEKEEMFHVPFDNRGKIETTRFSIPGVPCLYLSNTSYGCWVELERPVDQKLSVSPVIVTDEIRILNLSVSILDIFDFVDGSSFQSEDERYQKFLEYIKIMVLVIASSYVVDEPERKFKSEYIIPQMIMKAARDNDIDGVVYYSKKVKSELYARTAVNVALYAEYNPYEDFLYSSKLANRVKIGKSYNFAMFQHLRKSVPYSMYRLLIDELNGRVYMSSGDRHYNYRDTVFHRFDEHIFANWKKREKPC